MSTQIVEWKQRMAEITKVAVAAEKPSGGWLSFKGGRLSYADQMLPGDAVRVVIMDQLLENSWYEADYDPNKPASPACYAFGRTESEMAPHEKSDSPQAQACDGCPMNEWGSDRKGGKGKDCKNTRRLAMIHEDALKGGPEGIDKADIIFAKLPVMSVKNFSTFVNQVGHAMGLPPFGVVCELSVKPHPVSQYQVHFKVIEGVNEALLPALVAKHDKAAEKLNQPYISNAELAGDAPKAAPKKGKY